MLQKCIKKDKCSQFGICRTGEQRESYNLVFAILLLLHYLSAFRYVSSSDRTFSHRVCAYILFMHSKHARRHECGSVTSPEIGFDFWQKVVHIQTLNG